MASQLICLWYNFSVCASFEALYHVSSFSGVWSRLSDSDALEETWKLSYTSSNNFKWLLQSVNVTFEKIMVRL